MGTPRPKNHLEASVTRSGCDVGGFVGATIRRGGLIDLIVASSAPLVLLAAPPGSGKSVLARQVSAEYDSAAFIDCDGRPFDEAHLARGIARLVGLEEEATTERIDSLDTALRALAAKPASIRGSCIVLDTVDIAQESESFLALWAASQLMAQAGCRLIACTRSVEWTSDSGTHQLEVLGPNELRLDSDEAEELATLSLGQLIDTERIEEARLDCDGHAGLFALTIRATPSSVAGRRRRVQVAPRMAALMRQIVDDALSDSDRSALVAAALMHHGAAEDLEALGIPNAAVSLRAIGLAMPLVRVVGFSRTGVTFVVHELLRAFVVDQLLSATDLESTLDAHELVARLADRGDYGRAAEVLRAVGVPDDVCAFLAAHGSTLIEDHLAADAHALLTGLPLARVMADPRLLLTWSDALLDLDEFDGALAKARAAWLLAQHDADYALVQHGIANCVEALRLMNRWDEAIAMADTAVATQRHGEDGSDPAMSLAIGRLMLVTCDYDGARMRFESALEGVSRSGRAARSIRAQAESTLGILPSIAEGDFVGSIRALSSSSATTSNSQSRQAASRGNLAAALLETGRVGRCLGLARGALDSGAASARVHFLPVIGSARFAAGEERVGLSMVADGISRALAAGAEAEAAQNRVYEAMLLRAHGDVDGSLASAERAYERLCVQDFMDFRRLAALEIAASLLALGDPSAARAWVEPVFAAGFGVNEHHRFRANMILSECDRIDGDYQGAVARIASQADHVRSENSNFQAAIYCRAFPALLGTIVGAVGAADVPVHLLRLVPNEASERALRASQDTLPPEEWAVLGKRLLGHSQFAAFVERKGRPLCRVRLFGGLEVTVGDRVIREKDWRKRKARMLFAIMVLERGRQLSREQLLAHVWPDLPEERAKNNFYVAWSTMKNALTAGAPGPCPYVDNTGGLCSIVRDAVRSDADEFEEHLAAARLAEAGGDSERAIESYERLASAYRGELLPGDLYDEWFAPIRDRYRLDFVAAMLRVVELLLEADDPNEAAVYARRALSVDPYREDLYQALLRCQIASGQRSAAIETFVACKTQIAEELGLDPAPETVALYQQILCMEERPRYDDFGLNASS